MKFQSFLFVLTFGLFIGPTPIVAQEADNIFISLGEFLIHPDTPSPDVLNTPGQVIGGMTGAFWNVINESNEDPDLLRADGFSGGAEFLQTGRSGGGKDPVPAFNPGKVLWWGDPENSSQTWGLSSQGQYDRAPADPNVLSGILSGPAGSQGHAWQRSAGVRVRDIVQGTYEIYATGVPYDTNWGGLAAVDGQDVDMYIGRVFHDFSGEQNLEQKLAEGELIKFSLTHENYTSWELGDNYARALVTINSSTQALMVGVDLSLQPNPPTVPGIGTIEIRRVGDALVGAFDVDADVDGADFLAWQRDPSPQGLQDWQDNFGSTFAAGATVAAVPEPASSVLLFLGAMGLLSWRHQNRNKSDAV